MVNVGSFLPTLGVVAALYLIAVASPGPNFFVLSQLSLAGRLEHGVRVALGIALGSTIWGILSMVGVASLVASVDWIYATVRLVGAGYLIWFGAQLLRSSTRDKHASHRRFASPSSVGSAFRTGVVTSLTNPKSGAFWTSVFASIFPPHAPLWVYVATTLMIAAISLIWHLGIVFLFTSRQVQIGYQKLKRPIDGLCGALLIALGGRLAVTR